MALYEYKKTSGVIGAYMDDEHPNAKIAAGIEFEDIMFLDEHMAGFDLLPFIRDCLYDSGSPIKLMTRNNSSPTRQNRFYIDQLRTTAPYLLNEANMNITRGDVSFQSDTKIFNFSKRPLYTNTRDGMKRMIRPGSPSGIPLVGKILIVETNYIDHPEAIVKEGGPVNYLDRLVKDLTERYRLGEHSTEVTKTLNTYSSALEYYNLTKKKMANTQYRRLSCIKLIRCLIIDEPDVAKLYDENMDLYIHEYDLVISTSDQFNISNVPVRKKVTSPRGCKETFEASIDNFIPPVQDDGGLFYCKIVDPNSIVGPKWMYMLGRAFKVPVTRDKTIEPGLYVSNSLDPNTTIEAIPLDMINEYKGLFDSKEEAEKANDLVTSAIKVENIGKHETARIKADSELEKTVHEKEILAMKREMERIKMEAEKKERKNKKKQQEREEQLRDAKLKAEEAERLAKEREREREREWQERMNKEKYDNERQKSTSDFFTNMIKLAVSVVTALGVLYTVFAKKA